MGSSWRNCRTGVDFQVHTLSVRGSARRLCHLPLQKGRYLADSCSEPPPCGTRIRRFGRSLAPGTAIARVAILFSPFFLSVLPAPSWPNGLGKMNLDNFRLSGGVRGWLFSPIDMTYSTSRFAEGTDGYLGLVIPVILIASILIVRRGTARTQDAGDLRCSRYSSVVDSDGLHPLLAAWHLDTGFGRQLHMSTNTVARLALYPNPGSARLVSRLVSATYQAR